MPRKHFFLSLALLTTLFLAGCNALGSTDGAQTTPTVVPIAVAETGVVVEGRLVPRETVELSFESGGEVDEVLVAEGDVVAKGQILARLGNRAQLESSISAARLEQAAAEMELLNAQQALKQLNDEHPQVLTAALETLTLARDELHDAEKQMQSLNTPSSEADIDEAHATVILARDTLDKAREDYEPYENKPEDNLVRAAYLSRLASAQQHYDAAVRRLNNLQGTANDFDLSQATAEFEVAQQRLAQAESDYDELKNGPDPDQVASLEARINTAETRISSAQAGILAAETALDNLDLVATIDGTIVDMHLIPGQRVNPGVALVRLADFSTWYVETDNLTEIEVVDVVPDQTALIVADALPDLEFEGVVESISDVYEEKRGDVTYTARIKLPTLDARLRWGMTVVVTIQP